MLRLPETIDDLNEAFALWLQEEYHYHIHYGINTRPIDRFMPKVGALSRGYQDHLCQKTY